MIVYHGTPNDFDIFDPTFFGRGEGASNGALGVWVTDDFGIASRFLNAGGYVMELEIPCNNPFDLPISEFVAMHDAAQYFDDPHSLYENFRSDLIAMGHDLIRIIENDGSHPTMVCLAWSDIKVLAKHIDS